MDDLNKKINMEKFASLVGLSYQTIYRYIKSGQLLPRRTLGGKPYFILADVELFKEHHSAEPLILDGAPTNGNNN
jgi:predicted DNA-binding transcriptional regulator AlpA